MNNRLTLAILTTMISSFANAMTIDGLGEYNFEKMNDSVYVMHGPTDTPNIANEGFMNNPGLIIGNNNNILVDPGSSFHAAKIIKKDIVALTGKGVIAVFNTHVHGDHWLGNQAFESKSSNIYASESMISQAKAGEGERWAGLLVKYTDGLTESTKPVYPNHAVKHLDKIEVEGQTFIIHAPTETAHTNTDIMIEHVESKTLFLGDNLFNGRFGRFDSSSSILNNLQVLDYAEELGMSVYVPGHGQSGEYSKSVLPFHAYLKLIVGAAKAGYEDELEDYEIKANLKEELSRYSDWNDFEMIGGHINKVLMEIEALEF